MNNIIDDVKRKKEPWPVDPSEIIKQVKFTYSNCDEVHFTHINAEGEILRLKTESRETNENFGLGVEYIVDEHVANASGSFIICSSEEMSEKQYSNLIVHLNYYFKQFAMYRSFAYYQEEAKRFERFKFRLGRFLNISFTTKGGITFDESSLSISLTPLAPEELYTLAESIVEAGLCEGLVVIDGGTKQVYIIGSELLPKHVN